MTRFGEFSPFCQYFVRVYLLFAKTFSLLWQFFIAIGSNFTIFKGPTIEQINYPSGHAVADISKR